MRMSESEYAALIANRGQTKPLGRTTPRTPSNDPAKAQEVAKGKGSTAKRSKYGNKKVTVDGITFDSAKEARRWQELKLLEAAGEIQALERQKVFILAPAVILGGRVKPALRYFADAVYRQDGRQVVEDTKSEITRKHPVFRAKQHLMMSVHSIELTLT